MNKIPNHLQKKQERQRQESINKVLRAISSLQAEGYRIRIKDLIEYTGLSRSIFAKEHIRQLLVDNGICQETQAPTTEHKSPANKSTRISNLQKCIDTQEARIQSLTAENAALKDECALLRGKLFLLMQRR